MESYYLFYDLVSKRVGKRVYKDDDFDKTVKMSASDQALADRAYEVGYEQARRDIRALLGVNK